MRGCEGAGCAKVRRCEGLPTVAAAAKVGAGRFFGAGRACACDDGAISDVISAKYPCNVTPAGLDEPDSCGYNRQ